MSIRQIRNKTKGDEAMSRTLYSEIEVDEESEAVTQATTNATTALQTVIMPTVVCIDSEGKGDSLIVLTPAEERFLKNVKRIAVDHERNVQTLGMEVDLLIAEKGGVKYGEETFKKMQDYPDLPFTSKYLRQCWHVYRTITELSGELQVVAPNLSQSH